MVQNDNGRLLVRIDERVHQIVKIVDNHTSDIGEIKTILTQGEGKIKRNWKGNEDTNKRIDDHIKAEEKKTRNYTRNAIAITAVIVTSINIAASILL